MNAKDLHPGLGSGALREALERLDVHPCAMNPCDHFPKHTWEPILSAVRAAALSLSSPTEGNLPPNIHECAHATWAENEQKVKVCMDCAAEFINERWVKQPSLLDAGNSLAYWYHVRCHGGNAQDLPQCKLDGCRQWRAALAPSRQGAGGK